MLPNIYSAIDISIKLISCSKIFRVHANEELPRSTIVYRQIGFKRLGLFIRRKRIDTLQYIQSVRMASSSRKVNPRVPTLLIRQVSSVSSFLIPSGRSQTMIMVPSELLQCRQLEIVYCRHFDLKN